MSRKGIGGKPSEFKNRAQIVIYLEQAMKEDLEERLEGRSFSYYIRSLIEKDLYGSD